MERNVGVADRVIESLSDPSQWILWLVGACVATVFGWGLRALLKKPEPKRFEGVKKNDRATLEKRRSESDLFIYKDFDKNRHMVGSLADVKPGQVVALPSNGHVEIKNVTFEGFSKGDLAYLDIARERAAGGKRPEPFPFANLWARSQARQGIIYPNPNLTDDEIKEASLTPEDIFGRDEES